MKFLQMDEDQLESLIFKLYELYADQLGIEIILRKL